MDIENAVLAYRQGKTTILISHRSSVIKRAEQIIYLEKGKLKLQGTIEEVKQQQGEHLDFLE